MENKLSTEVFGDIVNAFRGALIAFTPACHANGWGLGVAVANEAGYMPIPTFHYTSDDMEAATKEADRLNALYGHDIRAAMDIVMSSMAAGKVSA